MSARSDSASRHETIPARSVFIGLLVVVALAPLPLGSARPWSWSLLALAVGALLLAWCVLATRRTGVATVPVRRIAVPLFCFGAGVAWTALQTVSWTPAAWHHPAWAEAATALGRELEGAIALDPAAGRDGVMRLLTYAGMFWLALNYGVRRANARRVLWLLACVGAAYAAYGMYEDLSGSAHILWLEKWAYVDVSTGPFVNRNTFATYAGIGLVVTLGLLASELGAVAHLERIDRAGIVFFFEHLRTRHFLLVLMAAVIGVALLLSESRAGLIATILGISVLPLTLPIRRIQHAGTVVAFAAVAIVGAFLLLQLGGQAVVNRLAKLSHGDSGRAAVHALALEAIADRPSLGSGLGSFPMVFQAYWTEHVAPKGPPFRRAHNTYLTLALEAGLPAALLIGVAPLAMVGLCAYGVAMRRRSAEFPCIGLGVSALVGSHALVDFSLEIPAVAVTYMALMGVCCAQSWPTADRELGQNHIDQPINFGAPPGHSR